MFIIPTSKFIFELLTEKPPLSEFNCWAFQRAAADTWNRIKFSRSKPNLRIHETTVTQNLVYEFNKLSEFLGSSNKLDIFESKDEKANGSDLFLSVQRSDGSYLNFAIQAKIIYHINSKLGVRQLNDGTYPQMDHTVGGKSQIDILLDYTSKQEYPPIPLYLFYNYVEGFTRKGNMCGIDFDSSQYGCSIISARYLNSNFLNSKKTNLRNNVKFSELHPIVSKIPPKRLGKKKNLALPWFVLVCCLPNYDKEEIQNILGLNKEDSFDFSPENPFLDKVLWKNLREVGSTDEIVNPDQSTQNNLLTFRPKFGISIGYLKENAE